MNLNNVHIFMNQKKNFYFTMKELNKYIYGSDHQNNIQTKESDSMVFDCHLQNENKRYAPDRNHIII